jgi:hypothetical protein
MRSITRRAMVAALAGATVTAVAVMVASQVAAHGQDQAAIKLEGAWIARVTSSPFPPAPYQWTYILARDASGRRAGIHGSVDVAFPNPIAHDRTTPLLGEIVQTGPDTAAFNSIWYGLNQGVVVFIGRNGGTVRFLGPGKAEVQHNFELYLPSADIDGDGLPDGPPAAAFGVTSLDTRVPSPLN